MSTKFEEASFSINFYYKQNGICNRISILTSIINFLSFKIKQMLGNSYESDIVIDAALLLCSLHNGSVELTKQNSKSISGAQVCSNTFPILLLPPKKIDVGMILQVGPTL